MTYVPAAPEFERLPWLNDDTRPVPRSQGRTPLILWSGLAALLVAGGSYWVGLTNSSAGTAEPARAGEASATISLPDPYRIAGNEQVAPPIMPQVDPVEPPPSAEIRAQPARRVGAGSQGTRSNLPQVGRSRSAEAREAVRASSSAAGAQSKSGPLEAWPAEQSDGAAGRMVRIGTFGTRLQAKRGWRAIVGIYPGMNGLQAVVVPHASLPTGRTYYRLQFGTTSQAHSAVLCQRMRSIGQSCVVVGSPAGELG